MTASDPAAFGALAAIFAMALATHLIRFAGYWAMGRIAFTPRLRRMLDALPGSVVAATVAPIVVNSGTAAALGVTVAALMMALRRNEFLAVAVGMTTVALVRAVGM